MIKFQTHQ